MSCRHDHGNVKQPLNPLPAPLSISLYALHITQVVLASFAVPSSGEQDSSCIEAVLVVDVLMEISSIAANGPRRNRLPDSYVLQPLPLLGAEGLQRRHSAAYSPHRF